jgi:hypothetical protein
VVGDDIATNQSINQGIAMYLNVVVHTPVGTVRGSLAGTPAPMKELEQLRDTIQTNPERLTYVVVFCGDAEMLIPGEVFMKSVTEFRIQDKPFNG